MGEHSNVLEFVEINQAGGRLQYIITTDGNRRFKLTFQAIEALAKRLIADQTTNTVVPIKGESNECHVKLAFVVESLKNMMNWSQTTDQNKAYNELMGELNTIDRHIKQRMLTPVKFDNYYPHQQEFVANIRGEEVTFTRGEIELYRDTAIRFNNLGYLHSAVPRESTHIIYMDELDRGLAYAAKLNKMYRECIEIQDQLKSGAPIDCSCGPQEGCSDCPDVKVDISGDTTVDANLQLKAAANDDDNRQADESQPIKIFLHEFRCNNGRQPTGRVYKSENIRAKLQEAIDNGLLIFNGANNAFDTKHAIAKVVDFEVYPDGKILLHIVPTNSGAALYKIRDEVGFGGMSLHIFNIARNVGSHIEIDHIAAITNSTEEASTIDWSAVGVRRKAFNRAVEDATSAEGAPVKIVDISESGSILYVRKG